MQNNKQMLTSSIYVYKFMYSCSKEPNDAHIPKHMWPQRPHDAIMWSWK